MLQTSLTHYAPHDEDAARCGAVVTPATRHSTRPTCAACAASVAVLEDAPPHTDTDALVAGAVAFTREYAAIVVRLAQVYTIETDQAEVISLVRAAQQAVRR